MTETDGGCFTKPKATCNCRSAPKHVTAITKTDRDAPDYNMNHINRGLALIFNHESFDAKLKLDERTGTNVDAKSMESTLKNLDFDVKVYQDLNYDDLKSEVTSAAKFDHTDCDCFVMVVLSHGDDHNMLSARDKAYEFNELWTPFSADLCPTLAGKPKMFFIQSCRGGKLMGPVTLNKTEMDGGCNINYKIPTEADFLFAHSNIPGYISWRSPTRGSWFIESLCKELNENAYNNNILEILTVVTRKVALDYESHRPNDPDMNQKKQIPSVNSCLMRQVQFIRKNKNLDTAISKQTEKEVTQTTQQVNIVSKERVFQNY